MTDFPILAAVLLLTGCAPPSQSEVHDFGTNPGALRMFEHVPAASGPMPLLVVLHGCLQDHSFAEGAGYVDLADAQGFLLVTAEQRSTNNPEACFSWYDAVDTARVGGEAESIAQMIVSAESRHDVDRTRVGVTGVSAGAAMANAVIARWPDFVTVGAIDAGVPLGCAGSLTGAASCLAGAPERTAAEWGAEVTGSTDWTGPWPRVLVIQGEADLVVAPRDADALVDQWTAVHGIAQEAASASTFTTDRGEATDSVFGAGEVESLRYEGLGHEVPLDVAGGCGKVAPFLADVHDCLSQRIVTFLGG